MKIHELRPAPGSHRPRTRVGRGIAAGKGKTAGRGTKGQKSRAGASIPPWFEGGQTPLHQRIPKLRGFKPRFSVEYEVVNIGSIASLVELGAFESGELAGAPARSSKPKSAAPITVNQDILRGVGLVRTLNKPLKILGNGELSTALFVVADAFSKSAIAKIEAAGGSVSILEVPTTARPALGVEPAAEARTAEPGAAPLEATAEGPAAETAEGPAAETADAQAKPARRSRAKASAETAERPEPAAGTADAADAADAVTSAASEPDAEPIATEAASAAEAESTAADESDETPDGT
jgi:large subunit ribosomal protein L15